MKLKELLEEKILPNVSDKEDKKMRRLLKLAGKKERAAILNRINRVRRSEGKKNFTLNDLEKELIGTSSSWGSLSDIRKERAKYKLDNPRGKIPTPKMASLSLKQPKSKELEVGNKVEFKTKNKKGIGKILWIGDKSVKIDSPEFTTGFGHIKLEDIIKIL